jgi:hypothetical protein
MSKGRLYEELVDKTGHMIATKTVIDLLDEAKSAYLMDAYKDDRLWFELYFGDVRHG